ncbi:hypothetical protein MHBO_000039 [Bonamia ostreae]|uniref:Uncharacterized protein n=1 Tax=Bonamia ostreae TaxID=126728 RepID=A0ABV2AE49_9EUKA
MNQFVPSSFRTEARRRYFLRRRRKRHFRKFVVVFKVAVGGNRALDGAQVPLFYFAPQRFAVDVFSLAEQAVYAVPGFVGLLDDFGSEGVLVVPDADGAILAA